MISGRTCGVILLALVLACPAVAHDPRYEGKADYGDMPNEARQIKDIAVSLAFYARLGAEDDVDVYTFVGEAGERFFCQMTLPRIDESADFQPLFALIGPGLDLGAHSLPFDLPAGAGVIEVPSNGHEQREHFFEPFTSTNYWIDQELDMPLPSDGQYWIAVYSDSNQTGKYVLTPGYLEQFGLDFFLRVPDVWVKTRGFTEEFGARLLDWLFYLFGFRP